MFLDHLLPLLAPSLDISYTAYEPNPIHALELEYSARVGRAGLVLNEPFTACTNLLPVWDVVLLCHSLYGCHPYADHVSAVLAGLRYSVALRDLGMA